ncbi:unnamed protein product [Mytilus coruscus]|uniref:Uncharacterized protein n=1 Tax=Mytilus coruscus TaxID=42192 RepID=A0A6J8D6Q5_MYTCO|nr:unnamed protein product [Mytilus coruscus]
MSGISDTHTNISRSDNLLQDVNCLMVNKKVISIPVELFDRVAREFMPLRMQLLILFLKLFFTGIFLYVTFDSISKGGNAGFLTSQIPLIITVVMPSIAERICSPSNIEDDIKMNEEDIKLLIVNYKPNKVFSDNNVNQQLKHSCLNCFRRLLYPINSPRCSLFCPIFYTLRCMFTSLFFCCKESVDEIDVEFCPEDMNCCRAGTDIEDDLPLSNPYHNTDLFADDSTISVIKQNKNCISQTLNTVIQDIFRYCDDNKMDVNESKTKYMCIGSVQKPSVTSDEYMGNAAKKVHVIIF